MCRRRDRVPAPHQAAIVRRRRMAAGVGQLAFHVRLLRRVPLFAGTPVAPGSVDTGGPLSVPGDRKLR